MSDIEQILFAAITKFSELLAQSEERINRTNEMVHKLAESTSTQNEVVRMLTEKYTKHIDALAEERDTLIKQNSELLLIVKKAQEMCDSAEKRNSTLWDRLLDRLNFGQNVSESTINVKH